jgi:hypothetical protein
VVKRVVLVASARWASVRALSPEAAAEWALFIKHQGLEITLAVLGEIQLLAGGRTPPQTALWVMQV